MKKMILICLIVFAGLLFASSHGPTNIKSALNELESGAKDMAAITMAITFFAFLLVGGITIVIHYTKLNRKNPTSTWKLIGLASKILTVLVFLGFVLSLIAYLFTPVMINSLLPSNV
ncbi:hypothetical protein KKF81_07025 [Candidatus Micrarchaeota archaeon]|nr:hypothetical protein [Candidatus Micrarchaeota archaeon]MBU1166683.1 hypothetical protein [Candidatus Micrarchaeota archaeon]MBU1886108.1 hypothetical protein [Candidatus Micrarchaeota archaeon]